MCCVKTGLIDKFWNSLAVSKRSWNFFLSIRWIQNIIHSVIKNINSPVLTLANKISISYVFVLFQAPFEGKHFLSVLDQGSVIAAIAADHQETNQIQ